MKFVKASKPITTTHEKLGEIKVEVEIPVVESLEEAIQFHGGNEALLDYLNAAHEADGKNVGRAALRNLPDNANLEEAIPRVQGLVKNWKPTAEKGQTVNKIKAQAFDSVKALVESGKDFTKEELLSLLAQAK